MRLTVSGSSGVTADTHPSSSARFLTPRTTVSMFGIANAYRWATSAGSSPLSRHRARKGAASAKSVTTPWSSGSGRSTSAVSAPP